MSFEKPLITDEYLALNRQMHEEAYYGFVGFRFAGKVEELRRDLNLNTVLDYGCGRGTLGESLGKPEWLREYDPAVPGKDEPPSTVSDLVVCTDVLEHIEPDLLDNVISHINACSRNLVFLSIATVPAEKELPDGRNAHISLHDAEWWKKKLSETFLIGNWSDHGDHVTCLASSVRELMDMINTSAVSDVIRCEQAFINCAKTPNRVKLGQPPHDRRCVIVCYGPSLKDTWQNIWIEKKRYGATVVSVSGAHDFLIGKGLVPDIHMDCDPRVHKAFFTKTPHQDVEYQMASCCHPSVIDNLLGNKLSLWHVLNSSEDHKIIAEDGPDPDNLLVAGGGAIGCRAINVMYLQGYRSFSIYGFDCSFSDKDEQHAGPHSGKVHARWPCRVGGRWFVTSGTNLYIARSTMSNIANLIRASNYHEDPFIEGSTDRCEFFFVGDGLLQWCYRHPEYDPKKVTWINGERFSGVETTLHKAEEAEETLVQEDNLRSPSGTGEGRGGEGGRTVAA